MANDGADNNLDAFVKNDLQECRLAEATIISEDTDQSAVGTDVQNDIDGPKDHTEFLKTDDINPETSNATDFANGDSSSKNYFIDRKRNVVAGVVVGILALLALNGTKFIKGRTDDVAESRLPPVQIYLASIDGGTHDVLYFDRFLILFGDDDDQAYLSLSLSVRPSSKKVYGEVSAKRAMCRGAIYEVLKKAASGRKALEEAKKQLPQDILEALNRVLTTGTVEKIDLSEFLVV